ncbi:hypothetical protein EVAR_9298_1 [Eumeta japonica]|uniref:Uncharacterized protein n=1 Tax=Eumeta variegata TaxID=151549 RepID=A0A4C1TNK5_EUMVA|nr:hypothetical protein EVAR_9298_1 [Eumeta japonica]
MEPQSKSEAKADSGLNRNDPMYLFVCLFVRLSSEELNGSLCNFHWKIEELTRIRLTSPESPARVRVHPSSGVTANTKRSAVKRMAQPRKSCRVVFDIYG